MHRVFVALAVACAALPEPWEADDATSLLQLGAAVLPTPLPLAQQVVTTHAPAGAADLSQDQLRPADDDKTRKTTKTETNQKTQKTDTMSMATAVLYHEVKAWVKEQKARHPPKIQMVTRTTTKPPSFKPTTTTTTTSKAKSVIAHVVVGASREYLSAKARGEHITPQQALKRTLQKDFALALKLVEMGKKAFGIAVKLIAAASEEAEKSAEKSAAKAGKAAAKTARNAEKAVEKTAKKAEKAAEKTAKKAEKAVEKTAKKAAKVAKGKAKSKRKGKGKRRQRR